LTDPGDMSVESTSTSSADAMVCDHFD